MKQYFAKYLSVEGEIKDGDMVSNEDGIFEYKGRINIPDTYLPKKVKLFLCSRDICPLCNGECGTIHPDGLSGIACVKCNGEGKVDTVIGEISPDAKWVKEGDEFDKEEINKLSYGINFIMIKCPNCRTFH